jgi:2-polyprenyl-3-methyl-5-hydroxy-6-metoxy-1,4-benzoquinol methylase
MKEQDKQAERDFFNRGRDAVISGHMSEEAHINECFRILNFPEQMKGERILECGCYFGEWGRALAKRDANVIGVDIAEAAIEANKRIHVPVPNYSCKAGDMEDRNLFDAGSLDGVTCFNVLHHFPSIDKVIGNFAYWLKDGGVVYAVEPNGGNPAHKIGKIVRKLLPAKFVDEKGLATVNEMHDWSMAEYLKHFSSAGFTCEMKLSMLKPTDPVPEGWSLVSILAKIRWAFYFFARYMSAPINKGNPLVFKMRLQKV